MKQFKQLANGLSVSLSGNMARTSFRAEIPAQAVGDAGKKVLDSASLYYDFRQQRASVADIVDVPHAPSMLTDDRYVFPSFRALSQTHLVSRGLDFSTPGVLEAAVPMLFGKTIYLNHEYTDVNNWVGVISKAQWDAAGDKSGGVPGIAVECKVDAFLNYRIACGLMMSPPAVNAMSLTVMFEFEFSHPVMAMENRWKFFENLGEEVDGEIVRMIVTNIVEIWEASFVYVGEDRLAKNHGDDDGVENFSALGAGEDADTGVRGTGDQSPNSNEEKKTMKLSKEHKASLGIEFDGDDVPDDQVFQAIDALSEKVKGMPADLAELKAKAAAGEKFIEQQRDEVTTLAKLAELGAEEGELPPVITKQLAGADYDTLAELRGYYEGRVAERFPKGRSSAEDQDAVDNAGGTAEMAAEVPEEDGLFS